MDVIPFAGVQDDRGTIAWPPEMSIVMNVSGFQEALESAVSVQIDSDLVVPIVSIPAFVILKLFAWNDRRGGNPKDAPDIYQVLTVYADLGNSDRLHDQHPDVLEAMDYDMERAGAYLLGHDVAAIATAETIRQLRGLLAAPRRTRLVLDIAEANRHLEQAESTAQRLLEALTDGFDAQQASSAS